MIMVNGSDGNKMIEKTVRVKSVVAIYPKNEQFTQ